MRLPEANWMLSFFPYARISEVPAHDALQSCLYVMHRWGFIPCFRFDNGRPFGTPDLDSVSPCALVLAAMGCELIFNRPRSPTENAKVERNQGTTSRWAPAQKSANVGDFQQALDKAVITQREEYPTRVCDGKTRLQAYPELVSNPRRYSREDFCLRRAYHYLAQYTFVRKVAKFGQVSIMGQRYQVGGYHRYKQIRVTLKVKMGAPIWYFIADDETVLARKVARHLADGSYLAAVWP